MKAPASGNTRFDAFVVQDGSKRSHEAAGFGHRQRHVDLDVEPTDTAHSNGYSAVATGRTLCHLARRIRVHGPTCREANGR